MKPKLKVVQMFFRIVFSVLCFALIIVILNGNFAPFGATLSYKSGQRGISELTPNSRVRKIQSTEGAVYQQFDDIVYFTTKMPYKFDKARVKITFQNKNEKQNVYLGFKDEEIWSYDTKLIDAPLLQNLKWDYVGENPYIYQREKQYSSLETFKLNPPSDTIVGVYDYPKELLQQTTLADYKPRKKDTVINTPLRGSHTFFVYVKDEMFKMKFLKQDLNWYEGKDDMKIKIYKENDLVYEHSVADDGIDDSSGNNLPPQEIVIQNPGPEYPEPGVYKVVVNLSNDSVIKSITTNLHKIVFEGSVFPISNKSVYPRVVAKDEASNLYTNALGISATVFHDQSLQTINIGGNQIKLETIKEESFVFAEDDFTSIIAPKSNILLKGELGYFSFNKDQFFLPSTYHILPIHSIEEIDSVDYLITPYKRVKLDGEWKITEVEFDLSTAFIENGHLSWIIKAPGLKDIKENISIKSIDISFSKYRKFQ